MNFYSGYRVHNYHFAAYGAMFLGQYAPAIAAANELIETMPEAMLRIPSPPMADFCRMAGRECGWQRRWRSRVTWVWKSSL